MNRTSKITRLPAPLREELNQRLRNGEPAHLILPWLNQLPEVIALVEEHYAGNLISPQNLSDWNQGGYREWLTRQEIRESSKDIAADATRLAAETGGSLLNPLTTAILARYAALLAKMPLDAEIPKHIQDHLDNVLRIHQNLIKERRNDLVAQKTALLAAEQERKSKKPAAKAEAEDEYEEEDEEVEDNDEDEVEEDDAEEAEEADDGGEFGVAKGTFPKVNIPVVRWDERPDGSFDEAAHLALYAHTEEDLRRERERSKDPAGGYGLEEIKPEEP